MALKSWFICQWAANWLLKGLSYLRKVEDIGVYGQIGPKNILLNRWGVKGEGYKVENLDVTLIFLEFEILRWQQ